MALYLSTCNLLKSLLKKFKCFMVLSTVSNNLMAGDLTAEETIILDDVRLCENKSDLSR